MKRDFRRSEIPDLNQNFRNYRSGASLLAHYVFGQYDSNTGTIENIAKGSSYAALTYESSVDPITESVYGSPYVGKTDLRSFSFKKLRKQSVRLVYSATGLSSNQAPVTIAGWARMPSLDGDGDATLSIFTSVTAGSTYSENVTGALKFTYRPSISKFSFSISGVDSNGSTTTLVLPTRVIQSFKNSKAIMGGKWFHFAVNISNSLTNGVSADDFISSHTSIYINGEKVADGSNATGGDGTSGNKLAGNFTIANLSTDLIFAKGPSDTGLLANFSTLEIHETAIWSKVLGAVEIKSLYEAAIMFVGSGVVSLPPRVQIQNVSNNAIVNPLNISVAQDIRLLNTSSFFDDTISREFGSEIFINYSAKVPVTSFSHIYSGVAENVILNHLITASVASPSLPPDIYVSASLGSAFSASHNVSTGSGIWSDETINRADFTAINYGDNSDRRYSYLNNSRPSGFIFPSYGRGYSWNTSKTPAPYEPFVDSAVTFDKWNQVWTKDSKIGLTFSASLDAPRTDRRIVSIPFTNLSTKNLRRYDAGAEDQDYDGFKGAGNSATASTTGFCFFDWKQGRWADKGDGLADGTNGIYHFRLIAERFYRWNWLTQSVDPGDLSSPSYPSNNSTFYLSESYIDGRGSGGPTMPIYKRDPVPGQVWRKCSPPIAGFDSIPRQFFPGFKDVDSLFSSRSYAESIKMPAFLTSNKYAGHPMVQYGAPQDTRYYAPDTQVIDTSNYLAAPFMLEKIILELPVEGIRTYSNKDRYPGNAYPQDDYVFFLYRQERNNPVSSKETSTAIQGVLSASNRYLICSGNVAVYANDCWDSDSRSVNPYGGAPVGLRGKSYTDHFYDTETGATNQFSPVNSPDQALPLLKWKLTGDPFNTVQDIKWSDKYLYYGYPSAFAGSTPAKEVTTGETNVVISMTPAVAPKRRYGRFWEHTQVLKVYSGNYEQLSKYGRLYYPGGGGTYRIPVNNQTAIRDSEGLNINKSFLFASSAISARNPNANIMTMPTDISSSLNYNWCAPVWSVPGGATYPQGTLGPQPVNDSGAPSGYNVSANGNFQFKHFDITKDPTFAPKSDPTSKKWVTVIPGEVPPDFNRGMPVFCTWLGGTSTVGFHQINEGIREPSLVKTYLTKKSAASATPWYGQRFPYSKPPVTLTPLGVITASNETYFNYSNEPFSAVPNRHPNAFFEINQLNEVNTKRYFSAEVNDPRTVNHSFSHRYTPYRETVSSSFFSGSIGVDDFYATARDFDIVWNSTRLKFDPPPAASSTETGYLLFPGDELILGVEAAIAAPSYYCSGSITCITGSYLKLLPGDCKITLVGSYVKDKKRVLNNSAQQLLNANASFAIGMDIVTDQFEIESRDSYTGNFLSQEMSGAVVTPVAKSPIQPSTIAVHLPPYGAYLNGRTVLEWPGMENFRNYRKVVSETLYENMGDTYAFNRFVKLSQSGSLFYDSLVPNVQDLWASYTPFQIGYNPSTVTPVLGMTLSPGPDGIIDTRHKLSAFGTISRAWLQALWPGAKGSADVMNPRQSEIFLEAYNENWNNSFPYEPKYTRKMKTADGEVLTILPTRNSEQKFVGVANAHDGNGPSLSLQRGMVGIVTPLKMTNVNNLLPDPASPRAGVDQVNFLDSPGLIMCSPKKKSKGSVPYVAGTTAAGSPPDINAFRNAYLAPNHKFWYRSDDSKMLLKYLYGIETGNDFFATRTYTSGAALQDSREYMMGASTGIIRCPYAPSPRTYPYYHQKFMTTKPRGWKYGVMNALPIAPSAIFRGNRFGQFRDMLEQRRDSVVFNVGGESVDFSTLPVVVTFKEPSWKTNLTDPGGEVSVSPEETHSSNLSLYATSSVPYFDDPKQAQYPTGRNRSSVCDFRDYVEVTTDTE